LKKIVSTDIDEIKETYGEIWKTTKSFMQFIFKHKTDIRKVSNIFGADMKINSAFQMLKAMHKVDWNREPLKQELIDFFYCFINRTYGTQFLRLASLPYELCRKPKNSNEGFLEASEKSDESSNLINPVDPKSLRSLKSLKSLKNLKSLKT
jgi:hypothetical protein